MLRSVAQGFISVSVSEKHLNDKLLIWDRKSWGNREQLMLTYRIGQLPVHPPILFLLPVWGPGWVGAGLSVRMHRLSSHCPAWGRWGVLRPEIGRNFRHFHVYISLPLSVTCKYKCDRARKKSKQELPGDCCSDTANLQGNRSVLVPRTVRFLTGSALRVLAAFVCDMCLKNRVLVQSFHIFYWSPTTVIFWSYSYTLSVAF